MNTRSTLLGSAMNFAHLAGLGLGKKAKAKAKPAAADDQDEDDKAGASDDDDQDPPANGKKAKKAKGAAETEDDEDEDGPAASEDDDGDQDNRAAADEDDAGDEEDDPPQRGKKAKAARPQAGLSDYKRGRQAERQRCAAIFGSPHAAKNIPQAAELAFNTTLSADAAIGILKTAGPAGSGSRSRVNPDLGSDGDRGDRAAGGTGKAWGSAIAKAGVKPAAASDAGWGGAVRRAGR